MTTKEKMQTAQALIQLKQYDKARAILRTVNHAKAREWEAKLDRIAPIVLYRPGFYQRYRVWILIFAVAVLITAGIYLIPYFNGIMAEQGERMDTAVDENHTRITLASYCKAGNNARESICNQWAADIAQSNYEAAKRCVDLELWPSSDTAFTNCLNQAGITLDV
jgi:hypothetical protein